MRIKEIEKIDWLAIPRDRESIVEAEIFTLSDGSECLVVDVVKELPLVRMVLTKKEYMNYVPPGSVYARMKSEEGWNYRKIDNMYLFRSTGIVEKEVIISDEALEKIRRFCGDKYKMSWYYAIKQLQSDISYEKKEQAELSRQKSILKRMRTVPDIPDDFFKWAHAQLPQHEMAILPFRKARKTTGRCSHCGGDTEYKRGTIRPNTYVTCPQCGCNAKVRRVDWLNDNPVAVHRFSDEMILFQRTEEGFVERHFSFNKGLEIGKENYWNLEIARVFRINGRTKKYYLKRDWCGELFWDDRNLCSMASIVLKNGPVYPTNITKKMFEGTQYRYCAMELLVKEPQLAPIAYLERYDKMPQIEMMVKVGLKKLALECHQGFLKNGKRPWERIGVTKEQFRRLCKMNGSTKEIFWMEFEKETGCHIDDTVIQWFVSNNIQPKDIGFIREKMSERKIMNYLKRQQKTSCRRPMELISTWNDYIAMDKRLKMNIEQELFYKPKNLIESHNEAVRLCGGEAFAKRAAEIAGKFPNVDDTLESIIEKYEYVDKDYAIIVPRKIEDIIKEGRALGHCLDKSDIYFDRIENRESFIVFLRKTEDLEQPYYTLEIEPGGAARQKRTTGDRQNKDFDEAKAFIRKWQKEIQKRLSKEDRELAALSDQMRIKELAELREKKEKIWHGHLAGRLLADILEADFMAVEEEMRCCS